MLGGIATARYHRAGGIIGAMNQFGRLHVTIPDEADQLTWLGRLIGASTPRAVGELTVELARSCPAFRDARLLWLERGECHATGGEVGAPTRSRMLASSTASGFQVRSRDATTGCAGFPSASS